MTGALHRAWIDTKANLGGGDKTILESVKSGEDKAKEAYQKALATPLPADIANWSAVRQRACRTPMTR